MNGKEMREEILKGKIDPNNIQLFFPLVIKGALNDLRKKVSLRGLPIPHFILNTGDDTMYLEVKGQDNSTEPTSISNEDFVYTAVPKCVVKPSGLNIPTDELTNPYSRGEFELQGDEDVYSFNAEFRRMPVKVSLETTYYLDNYTDALALIQQLITNLGFINNYMITYLGQTIMCSYKMTDGFEPNFEFTIEGDTQDNKFRSIPFNIEVETSMPIYRHKTVILSDSRIATFKQETSLIKDTKSDIIIRQTK